MIIITGATKGIGRAISEKLSQNGQEEILAIARTATQLLEMQQAWKKHFPKTKLNILATNLATAEGCQALEKYLQQHEQAPTVLVNNVGLFMPGGLLEKEDIFHDLLSINLLAAHRLSRIVLPLMLRTGKGDIITIGSVASIDFPSNMPAYAASKYALEGWHKALSIALQDSPVKTSLLIPGATLSAAWEGVEIVPEKILAPQQIAETVAFLLRLPADSTVPSLLIRPK